MYFNLLLFHHLTRYDSDHYFFPFNSNSVPVVTPPQYSSYKYLLTLDFWSLYPSSKDLRSSFLSNNLYVFTKLDFIVHMFIYLPYLDHH